MKDAMREVETTYCKFKRCLDEYSADDVKTIGEWIKTGVPVKRICGALRKEYPNANMVEATFFLHVRGDCGCPEGTLYKGAA